MCAWYGHADVKLAGNWRAGPSNNYSLICIIVVQFCPLLTISIIYNTLFCKHIVLQGLLRLWDISQGTALRSVQLDDSSGLQEPYVRRVKVSATALSGLVEYGLQVMSNSSIACEFGRELRVVHFSSVLEKND